MRRVEVPMQEADQEIDPEIIAAHQQPDGTYVFGGNDGFYQEDDDMGPYEDDLEPYEIELNHLRSHHLRIEVASRLRTVDQSSAVTLDVFNIAQMPKKITQTLEKVEKEQDPSFFEVTPILSRMGNLVAYVGIDRTHPFDFIVEPVRGTLEDDPEISVFVADGLIMSDSFGHRMDPEYDHKFDNSSEVVNEKIQVEPHVFPRRSMLSQWGKLLEPYLYVSFGPRVEYSPETNEFK